MFFLTSHNCSLHVYFEGRLKAVLVLRTAEEEAKVWRTQEGYLISLPVSNEPMAVMVCLGAFSSK